MAKQQEWYLARDNMDSGGGCILSRHPLFNVDPTAGHANWIAKTPHEGKHEIIEYSLYSLFTGGKYKLRPGAKSRKVVLTPLGVKEMPDAKQT